MNIDVNLRGALIGLTLEEFLNLEEFKNSDYQIVKSNDEINVVTADLQFDRINLEVYNNIITEAYYG